MNCQMFYFFRMMILSFSMVLSSTKKERKKILEENYSVCYTDQSVYSVGSTVFFFLDSVNNIISVFSWRGKFEFFQNLGV